MTTTKLLPGRRGDGGINIPIFLPSYLLISMCFLGAEEGRKPIYVIYIGQPPGVQGKSGEECGRQTRTVVEQDIYYISYKIKA